jgi:hypothetical protein
VICTVPADIPATVPDAVPMVAIVPADELQVPPGEELVSAALVPVQAVDGPDMGAGKG